MNDNEKIENLEKEIKSLKGIIDILSKDAKFSPVKAQTTPENPRVEISEDIPEEQAMKFFEEEIIDIFTELYDPEEFDIEDGILHEYLGDSEEVTIPYGVIKIGNGAFNNNQKIEKINFPDTLTEIGKRAFAKCTNLAEINNIKNIKKIDDRAFDNCHILKRLRFSENIKLIGEGAFNWCQNLRISVPETCECNYGAFNRCKSVVIREVVK